MTYELPKIGDVVYLKDFVGPIEIRVDEILITEFVLEKQVFLEA